MIRSANVIACGPGDHLFMNSGFTRPDGCECSGVRLGSGNGSRRPIATTGAMVESFLAFRPGSQRSTGYARAIVNADRRHDQWRSFRLEKSPQAIILPTGDHIADLITCGSR